MAMVPSAAEGGFPTADADRDTTAASPAAGGGAMAVDFGWGEERKLSGRRRKVEASKKAKPGSFGAHNACRLCYDEPQKYGTLSFDRRHAA